MSVIKTLKSLKTFYPPDPKDPNYQQKVTDSLQQLSAEVNRLSDKVTELDLALTEHEAFYDAPIVCDQLWLTSDVFTYENINDLKLVFERQEQNWKTPPAEDWNGAYGEKFDGMFAGNNRKARTRYPHTLSMLDGGTTPGPDNVIQTFRFPVTGLYRIVLTCVFEFHRKSGQTAQTTGANPMVRIQFKGGSRSYGSVYTKNIQTVSEKIPHYPSGAVDYSIRSAEVICNVTRAADKELGQNYNFSVKEIDQVYFNTTGFSSLTYDIKLVDGREHLANGSTSMNGDNEPGGTNVIFQRIGPAVFDKPS